MTAPLYNRFLMLPTPAATGETATFHTITLRDEPLILLGKDAEGQPALLFPGSNEEFGAAPIALANLLVRNGVAAVISTGEGAGTVAKLALLQLRHGNAALRQYFVGLAEVVAAGGFTDGANLQDIIHDLVELFRRISGPSRNSVQGLWGELFLIAKSASPEVLLNAWHATPGDRYDFAQGIDRIEVKTSSERKRVHRFSLDQLNPPQGARLAICSIFAERTAQGKGILDLVADIRNRVNNPALLLKLQKLIGDTLGSESATALDLEFDALLAEDSLRFCDFGTVPTVSQELPAGISNVSFESDLALAQLFKPLEARTRGGLFAAV